MSLLQKTFLAFFLFIQLSSSFALEVDEKLTLRILDTSSSKKTILVNRGLEDGLVVGDHAKFFLTTGVIARGVVVKASPTRSIWSLYRLIESEDLAKDKVMNLKIATPVKLTEDPSKAFNANVIVSDDPERISVPLAPGADDIKELTREDKDDLAQLEEKSETVMPGGIHNKTWEVWTMANVTSLSGEAEDADGNVSDSKSSLIDFSLGVEKYFFTKGFLKDISFSAFIQKRSTTTTDNQTTTTTYSDDWFEYGVGANYHFYNPPLSYSRPILYVGATLGLGKSTSESQVTSSTTTDGTSTLEGTSSFFSFGLGGKYYLPNGFGVRAMVDYFRSGEKFTFDDGVESTRTLAGPRIRLGLAYRW